MKYIEMVIHFNEYHNTQTRKRFYIVGREQLNTNEYKLCHTEYNRKYSDDYDFYKAVECNGGLNYIAVRKPRYKIVTDKAIIDTDCQDIFNVYKSEYFYKFDELTTEQLQIGQFIEVNEYEEPQKIIDIITY